MKKFILLMLFVTISWQQALAQSFSSGGLNYNVTTGSNVEVGNNYSASNNVVIPATVTNGGITYNVTSIRNYAFFQTGVTSVTIPSSVTSIGAGAFSQCANLTSFVIPPTNSVTSISAGAFSQCTNLTSFTIPNAVTSIEDFTFFGCSKLTTVKIPASVTTINDYAFANCTILNSITCNIVEPLNIATKNVFNGVNQGACTLYVPCESKTAYEGAAIWGQFSPIVGRSNPTQVQAVTLTSFKSNVRADLITGVTPTDYKFKIVGNGQTRVNETPVRTTTLTEVVATSLTLPLSYDVSVATKVDGAWGCYGTPRTVTVDPPLTKWESCGTRLAGIYGDINVTFVPNADQYRYEISGDGIQTVTVDSPVRTFKLTNALTNPIAVFNKDYTVKVATRHNGAWTTFGDECVVNALPPVTKVQESQCGITLTSLNTDIWADNVIGVTDYIFKIEGNGGEQELTKTVKTFKLTELNNPPPLNTTYTIYVKVKQNGAWGDYGPACTVQTPLARLIAPNTNFSVVVYPNPSKSVFNLKVKGSNKESVSILVQDMSGKQIENKVVKSTDIDNISIGQNYSTGVYNVIVSQGMNTKTVRLVKK